MLRIMCLVLICCGMYAGITFAGQRKTPSDNKTEVIVIGTIHQFHHKVELYKPEVLKDIILALKPDAILNELPLSLVSPNGRPLIRDYHKSPEGWAADQAATKLSIKQIPYDRPDREENFKKTNYFGRSKRYGEMFEKWQKQVLENDPKSEDLKIIQLLMDANLAQMYLSMVNSSRPEVINSEAFDRVISIKHTLQYDIRLSIWKKYPGYEEALNDCKFFGDQWRERNRIMADNIVRAAKGYPGKRLVVLTGAEHRYILRDLLKKETSIELKEYWQVEQ